MKHRTKKMKEDRKEIDMEQKITFTIEKIDGKVRATINGTGERGTILVGLGTIVRGFIYDRVFTVREFLGELAKGDSFEAHGSMTEIHVPRWKK